MSFKPETVEDIDYRPEFIRGTKAGTLDVQAFHKSCDVPLVELADKVGVNYVDLFKDDGTLANRATYGKIKSLKEYAATDAVNLLMYARLLVDFWVAQYLNNANVINTWTAAPTSPTSKYATSKYTAADYPRLNAEIKEYLDNGMQPPSAMRAEIVKLIIAAYTESQRAMAVYVGSTDGSAEAAEFDSKRASARKLLPLFWGLCWDSDHYRFHDITTDEEEYVDAIYDLIGRSEYISYIFFNMPGEGMPTAIAPATSMPKAASTPSVAVPVAASSEPAAPSTSVVKPIAADPNTKVAGQLTQNHLDDLYSLLNL